MARLFLFAFWLATSVLANDEVRLKDLGRIDGLRENYLVGFGVVTGLAGTGDSSRSKATRQTVANLLSNFDISINSDQVNSRNVAIVSVTASLPPITRRGDKVDVLVTSIGDARSLVGGTLLLAPLKGPNGQVHALAQGPLFVGGYRYDQNGNIAQKNHPTVATIPDGAQIEIEISDPMPSPDGLVDYLLALPDMTTAKRVAVAINTKLNRDVAIVRDSRVVRVKVPSDQSNDIAEFLALLENITVRPDNRARVVINERTGMVVSGGDVMISKVTVAHGDLKVIIVTDFTASQPLMLSRPGSGIRTEVLPRSRIGVEENDGGAVELSSRSSVADLVSALNGIKADTRDIIAILQGIKAAGALHAELIIQ